MHPSLKADCICKDHKQKPQLTCCQVVKTETVFKLFCAVGVVQWDQNRGSIIDFFFIIFFGVITIFPSICSCHKFLYSEKGWGFFWLPVEVLLLTNRNVIKEKSNIVQLFRCLCSYCFIICPDAYFWEEGKKRQNCLIEVSRV